MPIAHRGGAALWPENTVVAFEGARGLGVRWVELDVHLSRDGELAVVHDDTVDRTTDGTGAVADHTLAELQALDAGYRHTPDGGATFPFRGAGHRIPTLAEAFAVGSDLRFVIEMKPHVAEIARAVSRFLESRSWHDRVVVAHAHGPTLRAFRRLTRGTIATSAGEDEIRRFWLAARLGVVGLLRLPYDVLQVPEHAGHRRVVDARFVAAAHARGVPVQVWTINDPADLERLSAMGVDGLITDRPDLLAS